MGQAGGQKQKSLAFFEKKTCILPVGYLTCSAKYMLLKLPIHHQNKGEEVCLCSAIFLPPKNVVFFNSTLGQVADANQTIN